ncbi:hypothetical protein [Brucella pseudogrignonensis]|uniref:Uncharacterized protein n=1 Tax=Brucella pseudogrignonensis TaxID=419475 RepID=A0ABU1M5E2_9HYPH|nr:hypothetical protein [Brucella pseudogrignonensis]MDR6431246.1 hypothetical protein [Brucella pseudogrignonensis]
MAETQKEDKQVYLRTAAAKGDVTVEIETVRGKVDFTIAAQGALDFGLQLIKAGHDAERSNG